MDVASNFCLLHAKLSKLGFSEWASVNEGDVMTGNPHTFALFFRFLLQRFPTATAALLRQYAWFVVEADDNKMGATTVRLLNTVGGGSGCAISATQYAQCKYAMAKINMCHDLLRLLRLLSPRPTSSPRQGLLADRGGVPLVTATAASSPPPLPATSTSATAPAQLRIRERRRELNSVTRSD